MALSTSEIQRCKAELGYNQLSTGAAAYVGISPVFEQLVAQYLQSGASSTSSTSVTAVADGAAAAQVTLTLAAASTFAAGDTVYVDVDDRRERATVQLMSGTSMTLLLRKAHSGTYRVEQESGESMVRDLLAQLRSIADQIGSSDSYGTSGIKSLDKNDVVFKDGTGSTSTLSELKRWQMKLRNELSALLGIPNMWTSSRGSVVSLY